MKLTLEIDTAYLAEQSQELVAELRASFPESLEERVFHVVNRLFFEILDVVCCDPVVTVGTGNTDKFIQFLRFDSRFELLTAALRAGEIHDLGHVESFVVGLEREDIAHKITQTVGGAA